LLTHAIQPDNFLFLNDREDSPLKMVDFGLAQFCAPNDVLHDRWVWLRWRGGARLNWLPLVWLFLILRPFASLSPQHRRPSSSSPTPIHIHPPVHMHAIAATGLARRSLLPRRSSSSPTACPPTYGAPGWQPTRCAGAGGWVVLVDWT